MVIKIGTAPVALDTVLSVLYHERIAYITVEVGSVCDESVFLFHIYHLLVVVEGDRWISRITPRNFHCRDNHAYEIYGKESSEDYEPNSFVCPLLFMR